MLDVSWLVNKNIVILGAGLTGLSCARFLAKHDLPFALNDSRENAISATEFEQTFTGNYLSLGHWNKAIIHNADILLVSPGIDLNDKAISACLNDESDILGDVELFCRLTHMPTIAVTGSNGKSTVVSLLAFLGEKLGYHTLLGGNIGTPVLDTLNNKKIPDFLILELSSFQLETLSSMRAKSATVLNVSDDHLDRHLTLDNYQAIKQKIYYQTDIAVINRDDKRTELPSQLTHVTQYSFGLTQTQTASENEFGLTHQQGKTWLMQGQTALIALDELTLKGTHNALNCLAVLALGKAAGWSVPDMVQYLPEFTGLAHRCERVPTQDGITWINDSKATNIGATLAAIYGFANNKAAEQDIYLIAGGDGKGADFTELAPAIKQYIKYVVTLGKDGADIAALTNDAEQVTSLAAAVKVLKAKAKTGDIVLLSPACASIDMFKNYIERGQVFTNAVLEVQAC